MSYITGLLLNAGPPLYSAILGAGLLYDDQYGMATIASATLAAAWALTRTRPRSEPPPDVKEVEN